MISATQAADGVSSSYDALAELFERIAYFLKRLPIYTDIKPTPPMTDIIVKIMVELLSVFALATKQIKDGRFSKWKTIFDTRLLNMGIEKFAKKLLGDNEIEAVLQRLDRLTQEESRMVVAETFEMVHGLVDSVKVVMNGTQGLLGLANDVQLRYHFGRWKGVNRRHPEGSWYAFIAFVNRCCMS
jgi:hypothetical protein